MSEKIKNLDNTQHTTVSVQADNLSKTDSPLDLDLKWIVSPTPHQHCGSTTRSMMLDVLIALLPALVWAVIQFGSRALLLTAWSCACCLLFEFGYEVILHKPITITDLSALVTGVLLAYNLPVSMPLWITAIGAFFAIVVVKQLFGGIGKNVVNPALAARVFLMLAWPDAMGNVSDVGNGLLAKAIDGVAYATPMAQMKAQNTSDIQILDLFFGREGGCIGEVSVALLMLGGIYLLLRRVITWHTPAAFLGTVAVLTFLFPQISAMDRTDYMLAQLCGGGLMLGAIYMATDYTTSPVTANGRFWYGVGCGAITIFIRFFGAYPEGVSFAILIMNTLVWYLDRACKPVRFGGKQDKKRQNRQNISPANVAEIPSEHKQTQRAPKEEQVEQKNGSIPPDAIE